MPSAFSQGLGSTLDAAPFAARREPQAKPHRRPTFDTDLPPQQDLTDPQHLPCRAKARQVRRHPTRLPTIMPTPPTLANQQVLQRRMPALPNLLTAGQGTSYRDRRQPLKATLKKHTTIPVFPFVSGVKQITLVHIRWQQHRRLFREPKRESIDFSEFSGRCQ